MSAFEDPLHTTAYELTSPQGGCKTCTHV